MRRWKMSRKRTWMPTCRLVLTLPQSLSILHRAACKEQSNDRHENQLLEIRAASCLSRIDTVLRQMRKMEAPPLHPDAMAHLRSLQKHMQDIVVLLCSRFMDQALLQKRGMPQVLISRLEAAFTIRGLQDNLLWCRLGDSKSHIFRKEMRSQPYRIPRRRGRARRTKLEASSSTRPAMARSPSPTRPVPTRPAAGHLPDDDASREPLAATGLAAYVLTTRPAAASSPSASGVVYHTGGGVCHTGGGELISGSGELISGELISGVLRLRVRCRALDQ